MRLTILKGTLANWVAVAKSLTSPKVALGSRLVQELEAEVSKLRKELAETRMERDIVKKAAAYFARESLPSTRSRRHCDSNTLLPFCAAFLTCRVGFCRISDRRRVGRVNCDAESETNRHA
jgi:transposase